MVLEVAVGRKVRDNYGPRETIPIDYSKVQTSTIVESPLDLSLIGDNSLSSLIRRHWDKLPGYVLVGDSTAGLQNKNFTVNGITSVGLTATLNEPSHGMPKGARFVLQNANQEEYTGVFTVKSVIDADNFLFDLRSEPKVKTATGAIILVSQSHVFESNWAVMSDYLGGNKGLYLGNFAQGGSRTSHLSRQLDLALLPNNNLWNTDIDFVFISSGINDINNDVTYEEIVSNLESAIDRIIAAKAVPIVLTLWPLENTYVSWSIPRIIIARQVNNWIRQTVPLKGGVVIDANSICLDLANQYGNWKTNYSVDGIHPQKQATLQVAKNIKTNLWDKIKTEDNRSFISIGPNPDMSGTGGTLSSATGEVADGFTLAGVGGVSITLVGAKGIDLTGLGESQVITVQGDVADTAKFSITTSLHSSVSPGDKVICRLRLRTESSDLTGIRLQSIDCTTTIDGISNTVSTTAVGFNGYSLLTLGEKFDLNIETPPLLVPVGLTDLSYVFYVHIQSLTGTLVFDVAHFDVLKLSK